MQITHQALILAALALEAVVAQPAHRHSHLHKRNLVDLVKRQDFNNPNLYKTVVWDEALKDVNWSNVNYGGSSTPATSAAAATSSASSTTQDDSAEDKHVVQSSPAETASPSPSPAASASSAATSSASSSQSSGSSGTPSSGGSGSCVDISAVWSKGDTSSHGETAATVGYGPWTDQSTSSTKVKRATAEQDGYVGNTGSGNYGTNIVPLSDCNNEEHAFSIKFTNSYPDQRDMAVMIWNKVGADGKPQSGPFTNSFFMIDLPAGKSAAFAFEPNSQIAFSESSSTCQRQSSSPGGWNCIWGEANFGPVSGGTTSWDVSVMLDPSEVPGILSIANGNTGISSRATCGFMNAAQQYAGEGQTVCSPNSNGPTHLTATFGVDLS